MDMSTTPINFKTMDFKKISGWIWVTCDKCNWSEKIGRPSNHVGVRWCEGMGKRAFDLHSCA